MAWTVAPNIKALIASVNKLAPNRDRASDGTIGDYAHSTGVSGHNPDDTSGTRAERTDTDTVAEVRAGDIDTDLRQPGVTMERIVQTVVRTPALRRRLIYVIYNRRIWAASSGWVEKPYTGSNPHDHHAHFSGHPDYDNDSSPWREIEALGADMDATQARQLAELHETITRWRSGMPTMADGKTGIEPVRWRVRDEPWQVKVTSLLAAISGQIGGLDTEQVLARIEAIAAEERQRDTELTELVRAGQSGDLDAAEVVRLIGERLAAGTAQQG